MLCSFQNTTRWTKYRNPTILNTVGLLIYCSNWLFEISFVATHISKSVLIRAIRKPVAVNVTTNKNRTHLLHICLSGCLWWNIINSITNYYQFTLYTANSVKCITITKIHIVVVTMRTHVISNRTCLHEWDSYKPAICTTARSRMLIQSASIDRSAI
jgi:hypothetical protein